ncbi:MAG: nitrite reductase small subunit NirD [Sulfuricaulis sp.]|uniref:nitrite reductase small subunit NirD n=1 Tax=Sulfuricaulis sp. TaxID=2003553 RepID=UPI0034A369B1
MSGKAAEKIIPLSAAGASGWVVAGRLDEIPRAGARVIHTAAGEIALFRTVDDRVFALRDRCPHQGGPLSQGIVYGHKVACPLHNWSVALDSGAAIAPDEGQTACFPVRIEGDMVYLAIC